jgi:hypothetical protein
MQYCGQSCVGWPEVEAGRQGGRRYVAAIVAHGCPMKAGRQQEDDDEHQTLLLQAVCMWTAGVSCARSCSTRKQVMGNSGVRTCIHSSLTAVQSPVLYMCPCISHGVFSSHLIMQWAAMQSKEIRAGICSCMSNRPAVQ